MDFRCFLMVGDEVKSLVDNRIYKIKEVRKDSVHAEGRNWKTDKWEEHDLKEGEFVLYQRAFDTRTSSMGY